MFNVFLITRKQDITANVFILFPITNFVVFPLFKQGLKSQWPVDSSHLPTTAKCTCSEMMKLIKSHK